MNLPHPQATDTPSGREPAGTEGIEYRSVNRKSIVGLLVGLGSPLALISPLLWIVPVAGTVISCLSLSEIRSAAMAQVGRKAALAGLALSIVFGSTALSNQLTSMWWTRREAKLFSQVWFDLLRDGQPHKALQLTVAPERRQPLDDQLWTVYRNSLSDRQQLEEFVKKPDIHALLALGHNASVQYWETTGQWKISGAFVSQPKQRIDQLYAVTYEENGARTTFFFNIAVERTVRPDSGAVGLQIVGFRGGVRPLSMGGP